MASLCPKLAALALLALVLAAPPARADVVVLDDGREIEGEIVRETDDELELALAFGKTTLPKKQIVRITRKASPEQIWREKRAALAPGDAPARIALARGCLERERPRDPDAKRAVELALEAFAIAPGDAGAIELLARFDYHFDDYRWLSPEEFHRARGHALRGGRWITPEDAAHRDAVAAVSSCEAFVRLEQASVREAELAIAEGPSAEAETRERLRALELESKALAVKSAAARAGLQSRDADLSAAVATTNAAREGVTSAEHLMAVGSVVNAKARLKQAEEDQESARTARDAARQEVETLATREVATAARLLESKRSGETLATRLKTLSSVELPKRTALLREARESLARAEVAEKSARQARDARAASDARDEAARLAAAASFKKAKDQP